MPQLPSPDFWTAAGTCVLAVVTIVAVAVAKIAADQAIRAYKLEAEPRLVVRAVEERRLFAQDNEINAVSNDLAPGITARPQHISPIDAPVYILDVKLGVDGGPRAFANGFELRAPSASDLQTRGEQVPILWPAFRIELRNYGRSPAIDVALNWMVSMPTLKIDNAPSDPTSMSVDVAHKSGHATIVVDGVGPNDAVVFWMANSINSFPTLTLESAEQRDPANLRKPTRIEIAAMATTSLRFNSASQQIFRSAT